MNERRVSLGNRALSLLLALVMVIGLVPVSVFAAPATDNTTTATNIGKVENYAQMLLDDNYAKDKGSKPTWDTEGKSDTWRYFNGLMVDALLMLGVNSDNDITKGNGNALEYAAAFYDYNVNSSGLITRYNSTDISSQELDSIQPARALFDLLGTTVDQDKYETVLHNMYTELMSFPTVSNTDGNFRHKDSWTDYEVGLDGIYMAQPFLMEYANAIDAGLISNKNNVNTATIYAAVADRVLWVANNMSFTDKNGQTLLNHGYDKDGTNNVSSTIKGNGVVWSRGVGWYMAGLVDVIEMMPAGDDKTALIAALKSLLDGMLYYQDPDSGMWYNVVYATDGSNVKIGKDINSNNRLETSGTALMAYTLLKAYNNGWVTGSEYKTAGLEAFNGMVNSKMTGSAGSYTVADIYRSAGVADYEGMGSEYFNSELYKNNEAKGVGPLLMAAAEASKAIGEAQEYTIGVASGDVTVPVGTTIENADLSSVKVTLFSNQGTDKTVDAYGNIGFDLSDTSAVGTATLTVYAINGSNYIAVDTLSVNVVDPTTPVTAEGSIGGSGAANQYERVTSMNTTGEYVITQDKTGSGVVTAYVSGTDISNAQKATITGVSGNIFTLTPSTGSLTLWRVDANNNIYTVINGTNYYVKLTGTSSGNIELTTTASQETQYTRDDDGDGMTFTNKKYTNRQLKIDSNGLINGSDTLFVFRKIPTGNKVVLSVQPNTASVAVGNNSALTTKVTVDGTEVSLSDCTISWASNTPGVATVSGGTVSGVAAGSTTVTATLSAVKINGETKSLDDPISVNVNVTVTGGSSEESYTYTILGSNGAALAGQNVTLNAGDTYTPSFTVKQGNTNVTGSYNMTLQATSNASAVTINGTTITANEVASDTVVNIRATVAPNSRASAAGTSVDFTVTVRAAAQEPDDGDDTLTGNISTTTVGSGTSYIFDPTNNNVDKIYSYPADDFFNNQNFTYNGEQYTSGVQTDSSGYLEFKPAEDGTLTVYIAAGGDSRNALLINKDDSNATVSTFAVDKKNTVYAYTVEGLKANTTYRIKQGSGTCRVLYVNYAASGSGSGDTTWYNGALTLNPTSVNMTVGDNAVNIADSVAATAVEGGANATINSFTTAWTSSNSSVATVDSNGNVHAVGAGTATITAKLATVTVNGTAGDIHEDITATATVTVAAAPEIVSYELGVTSLTISESDIDANGYVSESALKALIKAANGSDKETVTLTWTYSDGTTGSAELVVGAGQNIPLLVAEHSNGARYLGVWYNDLSYNGQIAVTVEAAPVTGSTYIHNFTTDNKTSSFYTIAGDLSTSKGSASYNGLTLTQCLKMNGEAEITFKASAAGTITLVFNTDNSGKKIDVNGTIYTIPSNGILTIDVPAGDNVIKRNDGESFLYYMAFAENSNVVAYSLSDLVFNPASIYAGQSTQVTTTVTASDGSSHTYTLQWVVNSTSMGDTGLSTGFRAMDAGEYTVTAKLTHVDGEELATPVTKTGTITVGNPVATGGSLNNASVTVTQGTDINLSALSANLTFSNNTNATVNLAQSGFTFKKNGSNINITDVDATVGTHTIAVYYDGVSIGNLTVTVNEEIQATDTVTYVLDTDGIDAGEEYIVVAIYNGKYYAMGHGSGSTTEKAYAATIEGNTVTIDESNLATGLWKFEAVEGKTGYYYISNGGYYVKPGGSTVFNTSKTATQVITHDLATGQYRINVGEESKERDLYLSSTSNWERADQGDVSTVYLYKKVEAQTSVTLNKLPMLYIGGTPWQAYLNDCVASVKYNGATATDYVIQWSSNDPQVASVSADGQYVNGAGAGTATIVGKLISVGGVDVSAQNITATTTVSVTVPSLELSEDVTKFVGESFTADRQVLIGSTAVENYELKWTSSNESVATVDQNGKVSVVGAGTATIYAQIIKTNGNNISNYLTITDSFTVNAEVIAITSGELSSDTVTVEVGATTEALQSALSGITLTLTKNNGETVVIYNATLFEDVDLTAVNTAVGGTYYLDVSYSDPNSDYVFSGTVTVKVFDKSMIEAEGFLTQEQDVQYILDTDGIDKNEEYVFVMQNSDGEWVAMMNPDADGSGSTKGSSQVVTRSNDGLTITVSQNADLVEWLFTNEGSSSSNGFSYKTFTVKNNNRYIKGGGDSILGSSSKNIGVWYAGDGSGAYYIGTDYSSGKVRALTLSGDSWTRASDSKYPDDSSARVYMYKRSSVGYDFSVGFEVQPDSKTLAEGTSYTVPTTDIAVVIDGNVNCTNYVIEWSSSDTDVATVDSNGKITAVGAGTATITATLMTADGYKVYSNTTKEQGISDEIAVTVQADQLTYKLQGSPLTVPLGGEPDFSKVSLLIDSKLSDDITVPSDQLVFKYIDAVVGGFDTDVPNATCTVDVYYNGKLLEQKLVLKVADNAYDGLDEATTYPEYPDPGAVRMNKFATGINFNKTGIAKIELNAAGISSRKPVDVVLIVDVSNSMNWSMDWFEGMTDDEVKAADDAAKTDSSKPDKLDMAMTAAQNFAAILMENNVAGSDANNTMTFVTFGGNDLDRGGPTKSVDSVVTAFVGEDTLANVNNSFANTLFTGSQTLKISGTDGNAIVSGDARGNTIYDAAFVEAIAAVEQLKIAKAGSVADYDASGREVHIIFMTDGAPSHYNDKCYDNSNTHGDWFTKFSPSDSNIPDDTEWLNFVQQPNADATALYSMVTDFHIVGYDLAHGGFGSHNWTEAELGRVLGGLVENKALDYTLATDTEKLNAFFDELGHSLAYAGTHALVTDIVSEEFVLQTDPIDLDGLGEGTETLAPTIQILERKLVVRTDIGKTLKINGVDTRITEAHLGMYVDGGEDILATVTFDTTDKNNKKAFSSAMDYGVDIWNDETNIITGKYFTYSFSNKTFEWHIGNIEDTEIALTYYGYLEGALEAERDSGLYKTNEEATLKYINTDNKIVIRKYPVPQVAWGEASVAVRFFLVDEDGDYTNLAGNKFNNPANRVFLTNRAYFNYALNELGNTDFDHFTGSEAFAQALISGQYALYDDSLEVYVLNSTAFNGSAYERHDTTNGKKTAALVTFQDMLGDGSYIQTTVDIPVVITGRLGTNQPLTGETVVLDYAKPIDVQLFNHNELLITNYGYKMELYGLAAYDPAFDTKLYLLENEYSGKELAIGADYNAGFGKFKIVDKAKGIIEFQPTSIAHGPVQVFGIAKITQLSNEANVYYLYNPLTIVPATTVYYETDFADGVFTTAATKGSWTTATEGNTGATLQDADPDVNRRDDELNGVPHVKDAYGSDSSYAGDNKLSDGSSLKAAGQGVNDTTVSFSFTGTGFDIISRTGAAQGMIRVTVLDSNGANVKTVRVTNQGTNELYQIPVVSVEGLEHGTYTVTIGVYTATNYTGDFAYLNRGNEFHFDAVRIYGTADGNKVAETEYKLDGEYAPSIREVRDLLITKDQFTAASGQTGAVYLDPYGKGVTVGSYINTNVVSDYKTQGPNNEVYLGYGQGIAFEIESSTVPATVQIGAKSVTGGTVTLNAYIGDANSTATATLTKNIATATDMYYQLSGDYAKLFADGKTYVVVWNTSSDILSITNIKVAYTTDPAETVVVSYSEEMATFASNLLVTAVEQDDPEMTVAKGEDGNYYYYVSDRVNEAYTGLVELNNGTWYVLDGQIVFNFDGAITFQGETYYIKAGRVSETTTGLYKYTGEWMYYTSGKVDTAYTGLAERNGMIVYVANGAVDFTKTGAVSHDGKLYYVRYGVVDSSFTGLVRADNGAWVYVSAGQQDTAYTGIVAHSGSYWYVENGTVNFQFTGTVADANGAWTVNRGQATAANN